MTDTRRGIAPKAEPNDDGSLTVAFSDDYEPRGPSSRIGWSNRDMTAALRQMFHLRPGERITGIEIDRDGIVARIRTEK